jgi:hypothetical protein
MYPYHIKEHSMLLILSLHVEFPVSETGLYLDVHSYPLHVRSFPFAVRTRIRSRDMVAMTSVVWRRTVPRSRSCWVEVSGSSADCSCNRSEYLLLRFWEQRWRRGRSVLWNLRRSVECMGRVYAMGCGHTTSEFTFRVFSPAVLSVHDSNASHFIHFLLM